MPATRSGPLSTMPGCGPDPLISAVTGIVTGAVTANRGSGQRRSRRSDSGGRDWCRDCSAAATEPTETRAAPRRVGARAVQKTRHRDASARPVTRGQTAGPGPGPGRAEGAPAKLVGVAARRAIRRARAGLGAGARRPATAATSAATGASPATGAAGAALPAAAAQRNRKSACRLT